MNSSDTSCPLDTGSPGQGYNLKMERKEEFSRLGNHGQRTGENLKKDSRVEISTFWFLFSPRKTSVSLSISKSIPILTRVSVFR